MLKNCNFSDYSLKKPSTKKLHSLLTAFTSSVKRTFSFNIGLKIVSEMLIKMLIGFGIKKPFKSCFFIRFPTVRKNPATFLIKKSINFTL